MKFEKKLLIVGLTFSLMCIALTSAVVIKQSNTSSRQQSHLLIHGLYAQAQAHFNALVIDFEMLRNAMPLSDEETQISHETEHALHTFFKEYIGARDEIVQVRIIAPDGIESFRLNNINGEISLTPHAQLQDKSDRYYFVESSKLNLNAIYISPLDLNIENGVIETPYQPVIRLASKLYSNKQDYLGIFIINFSPHDFIDNLKQHDDTDGMLMLVDEEGHYLYHPDNRLAWSFMFDVESESFANQYQKGWSEIKRHTLGQYESAQGEFFSYVKLELPLAMHSANLPIQTNQRYWYIINQL